MKTLLRLLAVPSVLLLVLPPGWCHAGVVGPDVETATPCGCCRQTPTAHLSDSGSGPENAPARPAVRCCCPQEATRPEKPVETDGAALVADVAPFIAAAIPPRPQFVDADPLAAPRPLNILQCVWRC